MLINFYAGPAVLGKLLLHSCSRQRYRQGSAYLQRFFTERLATQPNASPHTGESIDAPPLTARHVLNLRQPYREPRDELC
jgi:hypothetical protein